MCDTKLRRSAIVMCITIVSRIAANNEKKMKKNLCTTNKNVFRFEYNKIWNETMRHTKIGSNTMNEPVLCPTKATKIVFAIQFFLFIRYFFAIHIHKLASKFQHIIFCASSRFEHFESVLSARPLSLCFGERVHSRSRTLTVRRNVYHLDMNMCSA